MKTLNDAAEAGIITKDQSVRLAEFFGGSSLTGLDASALSAASTGQTGMAQPRFDFVHMLWYAGALIIMSSMGLFSTLAFSIMGSPGLLAIAIIYFVIFMWVGHVLWFRRGLTTPGGLLITVAVSMVPMAVFAFQDMAGWWLNDTKPGTYKDFYVWVKGGFIPMEVATIAVSLVVLRFYRFPFILFITACAIWFMSMDVADWLRGGDLSWAVRKNVSLAFGLVLMPIAWAVDLQRKYKDFGFWLHLVAILTFWGGLTMQESSSELGKFIYCLINIGLMLLGVFLSRRVYAVFGTLGIMTYLGHLSYQVFKDSLLFPFALTIFGLIIIGIGLLYYRNADRIEATVTRSLPEWLVRLRPQVWA